LTSIFSFHGMTENQPKFGGSKILVTKIKIWIIYHVIGLPECFWII
jgi:hypothetical protein